jgi:hypothetical protein
MVEMRKTTKNLTQNSGCPSRDSNWPHSKYNSEALPTEPSCSARFLLKCQEKCGSGSEGCETSRNVSSKRHDDRKYGSSTRQQQARSHLSSLWRQPRHTTRVRNCTSLEQHRNADVSPRMLNEDNRTAPHPTFPFIKTPLLSTVM